MCIFKGNSSFNGLGEKLAVSRPGKKDLLMTKVIKYFIKLISHNSPILQ